MINRIISELHIMKENFDKNIENSREKSIINTKMEDLIIYLNEYEERLNEKAK